MKKGKSSAIRALENKANFGDIKATFQLYKYYSDGKDIEENFKLASKYAYRTLELFKGHSLQVSNIKLIDFRIFQYIDFQFSKNYSHKNLAVIVGINGAGKTALLDAISKSLSWLIQRIKRHDGNGEFIDEMDIHNDSEYASIITHLSLNIDKTPSYVIELSKATDASLSSRKNTLVEVRELGNIYKLANKKDKDFNMPIMAYYGVDRSLDINKKDREQIRGTIGQGESKFDGYEKSLSGTADFGEFFKWFKRCEDIKSRYSDSIGEQATKFIEFTIQAIETFIPEIKNLRVQIVPIETMLVDKGEITLDVQQLSQGEKSLLALVADIARRLILLNPSLDNPLEGKGVILIDEIDLHLHPEWQQKVVPNLLQTFPNIQFILTTHSPQVLSTVSKESIYVLGKNIEGKITASTPIAFSYGEPSNDILHSIMHVDPQPPVPEKKLLERLTVLVDQGLYENKEAKEIRKILEKSLNKDHPQLKRIDRSILRQKVLGK